MNKAERLFRLVTLLRRGRLWTAASLAKTLRVSERTIYRDIQSLVLSGVPVEGEAGVGYVLRRGLDLPPLMFTSEEARSLALGARMVMAWGDPELELAARTVLEKVQSVAPADIHRDLNDPTLLVPGFQVDPITRRTLGAVRQAIRERRKLRIRYVRSDGESTRRVVRPLGVMYWGRVWSLGAWCEMRQDFRNFRLDRIGEFKMLKATFPLTSAISLEEYLRSAEAT